MTTEYKYAVRRYIKVPDALGSYVSAVYPNGHFNFSARDVDEAVLFDTATEAEEKTRAGRESFVRSSSVWLVVPVKVESTPAVAATITRSLMID